MDENKNVFSAEVEKVYKTETESAIKVPTGFASAVAERIKEEKLKRRKRVYIGISSAAALFIIIFGTVICMRVFNGSDKTEEGATSNIYYNNKDEADVVNEGESEGSLPDSVTDVKVDVTQGKTDDNEYEEVTLNGAQAAFLRDTFYTVGEKALDWNAFYNSALEGNIDYSDPAATDFIVRCYSFFESNQMEKELSEAKKTVEIVSPFEGIPNADKSDTNTDTYSGATSAVKAYIATNTFCDAENEEINWFEFYNQCIEGKTDPRLGAAHEFLCEMSEFFTDSGFAEGTKQAYILLSAEFKGVKK